MKGEIISISYHHRNWHSLFGKWNENEKKMDVLPTMQRFSSKHFPVSHLFNITSVRNTKSFLSTTRNSLESFTFLWSCMEVRLLKISIIFIFFFLVGGCTKVKHFFFFDLGQMVNLLLLLPNSMTEEDEKYQKLTEWRWMDIERNSNSNVSNWEFSHMLVVVYVFVAMSCPVSHFTCPKFVL